MDIRSLRTEADYDWALAEIEAYFSREPAKDTPAADRFDVLSVLIEAYEAKHWPVEAPDPVEMIREIMVQRNLSRADLGALLGSRSRASEVLNRRRGLTLDMVRRLSSEWNIPADSLIAPYPLDS